MPPEEEVSQGDVVQRYESGQTPIVIDHAGSFRSCELRPKLGQMSDYDFDLSAAALGNLSAFYFYSYVAVQIPTGTLLRAKEPRTGLVGTQLYGWGQYYERAGKKLYEHLDEVFSAIKDAGYDYAEGSLDVNRPESNVFAASPGWCSRSASSRRWASPAPRASCARCSTP